MRVLLAEDEYLIAYILDHEMTRLGVEVVGPYQTVAEVVRKAEDADFDAAVLDVNLRDGEIFPAADALLSKNIKVIFHTAYGADPLLTNRYPQVPICNKPVAVAELMDLIVLQDTD